MTIGTIDSSIMIHRYAEDMQKRAARLAPSRPAYVSFNNLPRVGDAKRFLRILKG